MSRVPAGVGAVERLAALEDSIGTDFGFRVHRTPVALSGGRAVLFTTWRGPGREGDVRVVDLATRVTRRLTAGRRVVGVHDGWLYVVTADGTLRAVAFDERTLATRGAAIPLLPGVQVMESSAQVALAEDGTLVYAPERASRSEVVWVGRDGAEAPVNPSVRKAFELVALSPRGERVALSDAESDGSGSVWLYELRQGTIASFAEGSPLAHRPRWTADGRGIVFVSDRGSATATRSIWLQPTDGRDTARVVVRSARQAQDATWSPDGRWLVYREGYDDDGTRRDLRYVGAGPDTTSRPFAVTPASEHSPAFSADGRWLAWVSNESGREEVYVAPFPGPGGRAVVSTEGGQEPLWARAGRELFHRALDGRLVAVTFAPGDRPEVAGRRALFDASRYKIGDYFRSYDVAADGRFLFIKPPPDPGALVIVGWLSEVAPRLGAP